MSLFLMKLKLHESDIPGSNMSSFPPNSLLNFHEFQPTASETQKFRKKSSFLLKRLLKKAGRAFQQPSKSQSGNESTVAMKQRARLIQPDSPQARCDSDHDQILERLCRTTADQRQILPQPCRWRAVRT